MWCTGRALDLDISLTGAPNFRSPRQKPNSSAAQLNVFGVAQPRINGLKAVLSILGCAPGSSPLDMVNAAPTKLKQSRCIFFSTREEPVIYLSGRPFVLRDASDPTEALALSDRAENLEAIEKRLKDDILVEAAKLIFSLDLGGIDEDIDILA